MADDKVYCFDNPGGNNCAEMMALMNNNNWANNPFMYLIWLAFFGGNGFGGYGNNRADADLARQLQTL